MEISEWVREARKHAKLSQEALGDMLGMTKGNVSGWENGRHKPSFDQVLQIARLTNHPPPTASITLEPVQGGPGVPLISWVQAGTWAMVSDVFQPGEAEEWLPCPVRHGPRTYAVKVRGESMRNPDGRPTYNDGDILFVDPDREANHGDRVIVRLDDQDEATFKQLLIEDGRKMLKALNPDWKPRYVEINGNATISGVVIGKWVPE